MMDLLKRSALALVMLVAVARSAVSQARPAFGIIDGVVSDTNLVPLRGAFVSMLGTTIRVGTGPNGRFRITKVPAGRYLVIVKRVGYRPTSEFVEVPAGDTARLAYTLAEAAGGTTLEPVVVTEKAVAARVAEFEARRKLGQGEFMTQAEIDARNTVFASELLRKFKAVNVAQTTSSAMGGYYALSHREGGNPSVGACPMQIYLDDVPMPTPFNLDLLPSPKDLAGIEVYSGSASIPMRFNGYNKGCGVILIWTKSGG